MIKYHECDYGRNCSKCPNERLQKAIELLKEAAQILEDVHDSFDGTSVKNIVTWYGNTQAILKKVDNDN